MGVCLQFRGEEGCVGDTGGEDADAVVCGEVGCNTATHRCNTPSDTEGATRGQCNTLVQHMSAADSGARESVFDLSL